MSERNEKNPRHPAISAVGRPTTTSVLSTTPTSGSTTPTSGTAAGDSIGPDESEAPERAASFGPFEVGNSNAEECCTPQQSPERRYDCANYELCLDLAAALNWENFTCAECCGEVNVSLHWRAHQQKRKDSIVGAICSLPDISIVDFAGFKSTGTKAGTASSKPRPPSGCVVTSIKSRTGTKTKK